MATPIATHTEGGRGRGLYALQSAKIESMGVTRLASWRALNAHAARLRDERIEHLFDTDPDRLKLLCLEAADLYVDMSKTLLDRASLDSLLNLARERQLANAIGALFDGGIVNPTETRPALHTLLRERDSPPADALAIERFEQVRAARIQVTNFSDRIANGEIRGFSGTPIRDVVNIGIGGSHLGPQLVCDALRYEHVPGVHVHFVSNVDGGDLERVPSRPTSSWHQNRLAPPRRY